MSKVKQCFDYFVKQGIWSDDENVLRSNFRKWALKNHPDKVPGNEEIFKMISECKNSISSFEEFKRTAQFMSAAQQPQYTRPQPQPQYTRPQQPRPTPGQNYYGDNHPKFGPRPQARNLDDLKRFAKQVFEEAEIEAKKVSSMSRDEKTQVLMYFTEKLQYVLGIYNVDEDTATNKLYENTILAIYSIFEGETVYPKWRSKKKSPKSSKRAKSPKKRKSAKKSAKSPKKRKSDKRAKSKSKRKSPKRAKSKSKRKSPKRAKSKSKSKRSKRKSAKRKSSKRSKKSAKRKSAKRKSPKRSKKSDKRKSTKSKSKRKSSKRASSNSKSSRRRGVPTRSGRSPKPPAKSKSKRSKSKSAKRKSAKRKSSKSKRKSKKRQN